MVIYCKYLRSCCVQAGIWSERALNDKAPDPGPHRGGCWTHHQAAPLRIKQVRERLKEKKIYRRNSVTSFPVVILAKKRHFSLFCAGPSYIGAGTLNHVHRIIFKPRTYFFFLRIVCVYQWRYVFRWQNLPRIARRLKYSTVVMVSYMKFS